MSTSNDLRRSADRRGDLRNITILFTVFNLLLLWAAWYASNLAPQMMEANYRSIKYGAEMQSSLVSIYLEAAAGKEPDLSDLKRFKKNLNDETQNITELNEAELVEDLYSQWTNFSKKPMTPTVESFNNLTKTIQKIVELNEKAMMAQEQAAASIGKTVLVAGAIGFLLFVMYSMQILYKFDGA